MRIHHCGAENGLIPPNEKFKKKQHCFHVPLCPFKYEKKYLAWIKSYDITCHFEALVHLPLKRIFSEKTIKIIFIPFTPFIVQIFLKNC